MPKSEDDGLKADRPKFDSDGGNRSNRAGESTSWLNRPARVQASDSLLNIGAV